MSVKQIEEAITQLPAAELAELMSWIGRHHNEVWDKQIEDDLGAGRLDDLLGDVDAEYQAGLAKPL